MSDKRDYYEVLGVEKNATVPQERRAIAAGFVYVLRKFAAGSIYCA